MDSIYRERARLVAHFASLYPSYCNYSDPSEPEWMVVYAETPEGQLSWHISPSDTDLFSHVPVRHGPCWDGHTKEQKYERLSRLTQRNL